MANEFQKEIDKGRVGLWLDPEDLEFLACEYSRLADDTPDDVVRFWMRIAARAHAALEKSGHRILPFVSSDARPPQA